MRINNHNKPQASAFHKAKHYFHESLIVFLMMFLTACGGGGGDLSRDTTTNPADPTTPTTPTFSISLTIADAESGAASNELTADTPLQVTAVVTNSSGTVVADQLVTYNFNTPDLATFDPPSERRLLMRKGVQQLVLL